MNHEFVSLGSHSATHKIVLLHGWGADAADLLPIGKQIITGLETDFQIVSLNASYLRPDGCGRQWYKLSPPDWNEASVETNKLNISLESMNETNIPLNKTILLGFSQGAAMAINSVRGLDLGLIVLCSGYLHPDWSFNQINAPVIISHGINDEVVPIRASREIYKELNKKTKYSCFLHEFAGTHEINIDLIKLIRSKIKEIF